MSGGSRLLRDARPAGTPTCSTRTKSERQIFREAGVALPRVSRVSDADDWSGALDELRGKRPGIRRAVLKFDESFSGEGNAIFQYPEGDGRPAVADALSRLKLAVTSETPESYLEKFRTMGGIVEEFLEGEDTRSPSCQIRIDPQGRVILISTHDQLLGGPTNQLYLGCRFPAEDGYRRQIQEAARRIGDVLASHGVVSRLGIDFVVRRESASAPWEVFALEINLRIGGTTHPFLALEFLTGGRLDPESGEFLSPSGLTKVYRSTDNLRSDAYRGLSPEDLLEITTVNPSTTATAETGVLFHMRSDLPIRKIGLTVIGTARTGGPHLRQRDRRS